MAETEVEVGVSNWNYVEIRNGLESGETVYVVSKAKEDSLNSLFSSMFTQQRVNNRQNNNRQNNNRQQNWNGNAPQMPSGGNGGGR